MRADPSVETSLATAAFHDKLVDTLDFALSILEGNKWYNFANSDKILSELDHRAEVLKSLESMWKLSLMSESNRRTRFHILCEFSECTNTC